MMNLSQMVDAIRLDLGDFRMEDFKYNNLLMVRAIGRAQQVVARRVMSTEEKYYVRSTILTAESSDVRKFKLPYRWRRIHRVGYYDTSTGRDDGDGWGYVTVRSMEKSGGFRIEGQYIITTADPRTDVGVRLYYDDLPPEPHYGDVSSSSTTTVTVDSTPVLGRRITLPNYYTGAKINFIGREYDQIRQVSSYDLSDSTYTVDASFDNQPVSGDTYEIRVDIPDDFFEDLMDMAKFILTGDPRWKALYDEFTYGMEQVLSPRQVIQPDAIENVENY